MKHFVKEFIAFLLICLATILVVFCAYSFGIKKEVDASKNTVFIWGDSQMVYGMQWDVVSKVLNRPVKSAANLGSGVYDFLVFAKSVPDSSLCIINYSHCSLIRNVNGDFNHSGIHVPSLQKMILSGFSIDDVKQILVNNRLDPSPDIFNKTQSLFEYCDTIEYRHHLPLHELLSWYKNNKDILLSKTSAFYEGLSILNSKHCSIQIVEFPFYCEVYYPSIGTPCQKEIVDFRNLIIKDFHCGSMNNIVIQDNDSLLMNDILHLNATGAKRVTNSFLSHIAEIDLDSNHFFIINDGVIEQPD